MSVEDESTSCYCLLDPFACHVLLDSFGTYALTGEPITDCAVKQLKVAVFGCMSCNSLDYNLRVYCVDNTPCAFQVSFFFFVTVLCVCASRIMTVCINFSYVAVVNYHDQKQLIVKGGFFWLMVAKGVCDVIAAEAGSRLIVFPSSSREKKVGVRNEARLSAPKACS